MKPNAGKPKTFDPNSMIGTLIVSLVLCVVCSLLVSSAAVLLRPMQEANKKLDRQRNVLLAAGVDVDNMSSEAIVEMFNDKSKVQRVSSLISARAKKSFRKPKPKQQALTLRPTIPKKRPRTLS